MAYSTSTDWRSSASSRVFAWPGPLSSRANPPERVGRAQRPVDVVGVERVGLGEVAVGDQRHGYVALVRVDGDPGDPRPPGDARERE